MSISTLLFPLYTRIRMYASNNQYLIAAAAFNLITTFLIGRIMPTYIEEAKLKVPGFHQGLPDISFGLSSQTFYSLLETYGATGRRLYMGVAIFDIIAFMFGYSIILTLAMARIFNDLLRVPSDHVLNHALALPALAHAFDLIETSLALLLTIAYSHQLIWGVAIHRFCVRMKWLIITGVIGIIVASVIAWKKGHAFPKASENDKKQE